jgi:hypothetical protein
MSVVELGPCFESSGYFVVITSARRSGGWWAWAEFEQDIAWGEQSVHVPVYRHRVPGAFRTKLASIDAGCEYAHRALAEGTVTLH